MKKNTIILDALTRMAMSLEREHWQAFVAVKGVSFPYTTLEKVRILKSLILGNEGREAAAYQISR